MQIRCRPWAEEGPSAAATWEALRESNPALRSPFFSWEFVRAVAGRQPGVEVAILQEGSAVAGYFPFQRQGARRAEPVGSPMNDYQGVIGGPTLAFDPLHLLEACGLDRLDYDHVIAEQEPWAPYHRQREFSPFLDLSMGLEAWEEARRHAGRSRFERLRKRRRALGRAVGPLRFEYDVRDERVLDALLALKSDQYRRTLGPEQDLFARPAMAGIVRDIFETRATPLSGVLSALWAGERLVAAHFGMRAGSLLHWWFPAFATDLARFSPGALLLLHVAEGSEHEGVSLIDFGKGDEAYKLRWANGRFEVAEGNVELQDAGVVRAYLDQELKDARLRRSVIALHREIARVEAAAAAGARAAEDARALLAANHDLQSLRASWSWRLTRPLRAAGDAWRSRGNASRLPAGPTASDVPAPSLEADLRRARADVEAIRQSLSWRLAAPLRAVSRIIGFPHRS